MTIREIAALAGVSTSTVSKIVNAKDETINPETRERVLKIVKEYNYTPYSSIKTVSTTKTFLLGIMLNSIKKEFALVDGIMEYAQNHGYRLVICESKQDIEKELKNVLQLCKYNVDGVIWEKTSAASSKYEKYFEEIGAPVCELAINDDMGGKSPKYSIDYEKLGAFAAQQLIDNKHSRVAYVDKKGNELSKLYLKGYKQALFDNNISLSDNMIFENSDSDLNEMLYQCKATGIVCPDSDAAVDIYTYAQERKIQIPEDISLITVTNADNSQGLYPWISSIIMPHHDFGEFVCKKLIAMSEKQIDLEEFDNYFRLNSKSSIDMPQASKENRIIVVGNINMDIMVNVKELPQLGKTVMATGSAALPGGKGANQAVGAAKLGADVSLIGKVGKDYEGSTIISYLNMNHVNMNPVILENDCETGKAYIHVRGDGESSIAICPGANDKLFPADVLKNKHYFENCKFCLLQTEIPMDTVLYAAKVAKGSGAGIILKPSTLETIPDELLQEIDYFIPNSKECDILCPQYASIEQKADYFLKKGVKNVVVTLGDKGCYLKNQDTSKYFAAENLVAVDITGAADAFIAALAVYLTKKYTLEEAIQYATCAAGLSVTRQGVIPALVDQTTLEMYILNKNK
ncbi:MAG: PfkB family carbohydrate kinase [Anaerocolumna sp.]